MSKRIKYLIIYLAVMIALTCVRIAVNEGYFGESDILIERLFTIFTQIACMGMIPVFSVLLIDKGDAIESLKNRFYFKKTKVKGVWYLTLILAVLHVVVNGGISTVWYNFLRLTGYTPAINDAEVIDTVGGFIVALIMSAVLPAFFEEVTHRGLVLHSTRGGVDKRAFMSALLFALMHQNITQTAYTFAGGLIMAYVVLYTGSIFPAMFIHFFNNAVVELRIFSSSYGGIVSKAYSFIYANMHQWWFMLILVLLWALAVFGVYYILKLLKARKEDIDVSVPSVEIEIESEQEKTVSKFLWIAIIVFGALTTVYSYVWALLR